MLLSVHRYGELADERVQAVPEITSNGKADFEAEMSGRILVLQDRLVRLEKVLQFVNRPKHFRAKIETAVHRMLFV
jgi:hypothetical protein